MRKIMLILCLTVGIIASTSPAHAKGRGLGIPFLLVSSESFADVKGLEGKELTFPDGERVKFQQLTSGLYLFNFLGIYTASKEYALVPLDDDESYYFFEDKLRQAFIDDGQLPKDLPAEPSLGWKALLQGYALWPCLILGGLGMLLFRRD